jgi:DNA-directed RNA polymerase specialized sigma subunit
MTTLNMMMFAFMMVMGVSMSSGFLNKIQLKYAKYIMGSPDVADDIKQATREILMENYQPWLRNQYKSFIRQNAKTMNRMYVRELYQYAIYGLLESLQAYNGSVGLHKYAAKFVHGQMYKGVNELAIMKPLKLHEAKRGIRLPKPRLVSYDEYWMFDKLNEDTIANSTPQIIEDIQEIMESAPGEYRRLFYLRYDYHTLSIISPIAHICELEAYSEETFRKKMKAVLEYLTNKLKEQNAQ